MGRLDGRVALVTGAGTGIGRASAIALAEEGAAVALVGRREHLLDATARAIRGAGGTALVAAADVTDADASRAEVARTESEFGRLDILVNNAGGPSRSRSVRTIESDDFEAVHRLNATAPLVLTQAALPGMLARGVGTVITISSFAAVICTPMSGVAYGAAKASVGSVMRSLNNELRGRGIRACTIYPGEADTPVLETRALVPDAAARATMMLPEDIADIVRLCACMPGRTLIEEVYVRPTQLRDVSADIAAVTDS
ncbi:MAG: SDR family NAD(P)-dependent oxidoreductase [Chloroflexota bacterium]|nr:SDR family NAD(P)-dependent oxidoreductase [Chloroflexota bacterium]MDE2897821.1 SDR family NAD(P)-dependent oxidoreductase [Chloroflexota bacterium]